MVSLTLNSLCTINEHKIVTQSRPRRMFCNLISCVYAYIFTFLMKIGKIAILKNNDIVSTTSSSFICGQSRHKTEWGPPTILRGRGVRTSQVVSADSACGCPVDRDWAQLTLVSETPDPPLQWMGNMLKLLWQSHVSSFGSYDKQRERKRLSTIR